MKIRIRPEGFEIKEGLRQGLVSKLAQIEDMFPPDSLFDVHIKRRKDDYKCEIRVQNGKDFIRAEEIDSTIEFSVNKTIKTLKKRVYKIKSVKIDKKRRHMLDSIELEEDLGLVTEIIRRKHIELPTMSEEEAILTIESLGHDFFIFKDTDEPDLVCILYKREIGYGVITTK